MKSSQRIYFDYASATPMDASVLAATKPYREEFFYNPSALYRESVKVKDAIEQARKKIADILKVQPKTIYFMDGATEANNTVLLGVVRTWQKNNPGKNPHVITSTIEHASVLAAIRFLEREGVETSYLGVNENGYINIKELKKEIKGNTILISIGYANGEIGCVQNIKEIMKVIRHTRKHSGDVYPIVHSDAVQAVNYCDEIGIPQLGIDMMVINASKIYGPKKIAVLYKADAVQITSLMYGGNQERGLRPGTENVPGIVAMARALELSRELQPLESKRLSLLQEYFHTQLTSIFDNIYINSNSTKERIPNIVNITFPNLSHEEMMIRLDASGILCSVKSACKAGEEGDSHVIISLRSNGEATGSLRFSMGRATEKKDINYLLENLKRIVEGMKKTYTDYYI